MDFDDGVAEAVVSPPTLRLSKSKIAAFEHCPRRLWLQVYRHELARFDASTLRLFEAGHLVGELARLQFNEGTLVSEGHREVAAALTRTFQLVRAPNQMPIFEAAFQRSGVIIRADILEPDGWGGWRLIEVKNSASVKPYQLLDVATQAWALRGNPICVSSVIIRHLERPLRNPADAVRIRFVNQDVTAEIKPIIARRTATVHRARAVLQAGEPDVKPGSHCIRPFRCEFRTHCSANRRPPSDESGRKS
jgi:hypothetical protein